MEAILALVYADKGNPFRYDNNTTRFFGRKREMEQLQKFLEADVSFCWSIIRGVSGSGKTRLGYEFANKVRNIPWWKVSNLMEFYEKEDLDREKENIEGNTLFVLNYVQNGPKYIKDWLMSLCDCYHGKSEIKIRVLLIEQNEECNYCSGFDAKFYRTCYNISNTLSPKDIKKIHEHFEELVKKMGLHKIYCEEPDLKDIEDWELPSHVEGLVMVLRPLKDKVLSQIISDFAKTVYNKTADATLIVKTLKKIDPDLHRPLYALLLTDVQIHGNDLQQWNRSHVLTYICEQEQTRIKENIRKELGLKGSATPVVLKKVLDACEKFLITAILSGGLTFNRAKELAPKDWAYLNDIAINKCGKSGVIALLTDVGIIPTNGDCKAEHIPPLEPNLIGKYYCILWAQKLLNTAKLDELKNRELLKDVFDRALRNDIQTAAIVRNSIIRHFKSVLQSNALKDIFRTIEIPQGAATIKEETFFGCTELTKIHIPNSVTTIEKNAFANCGLTKIHIPNSVTTIKEGTFSQCNDLCEVYIPDSVTTIGKNAFFMCHNLYKVYIPDSVTTIGKNAFHACTNLYKVYIPDSVTTIGKNAFS